MPETMAAFLKHLELQGKHETARGYRSSLKMYAAWLAQSGLAPASVTTEQLRAYQRWLADGYRTKQGGALGRGTQVTKLSALKAYYGWLTRRGLALVDVARKIKLPKVASSVTKKDYLTLQEATALLQTQAQRTHAMQANSRAWARECRLLALLCLALATGRRRSGLRNLKVQDLNFQRNEVRCEREKGKAGRVLPVKAWAMAVVREYAAQARPLLCKQPGDDWLFVGSLSPRLGSETMNQMLARAHQRAVEACPDLEEFGNKRLTFHSLRVSFASLLFNGGCNIRSINELMLHEHLGTTSRYTPIPLEDLRRVLRAAHPRA